MEMIIKRLIVNGMKNRYSLLSRKMLGIIMSGCGIMAVSCSEQEFTTGMSENQLITSITLDVDTELPVLLGTDTTIVYHVTPENPDIADLKWTTTNELVATVSPDGTISAKSLGKAMITVTPSVGFGSDATLKSIEVTVIPEVIKATSIEFSNEESQLYEKDKLQLAYEILPADHTYSYLTWGSSDENVATVDKNGVVTGINAGEVEIYAYTHDGSRIKGVYPLEVIKYVPATDVEIISYDKMLYWKQQFDLDYTLTPEIATKSSVTWSSSDENILKVEGGRVQAVGFGTATVTATCIESGNKSTVTLTVDPGFYVWDYSTAFEGWTINSSLGSIEHKDGKLYATVTNDANSRVYIQRVYSTAKNLMDMNFRDYPVIAFRCDDIPSATFAVNFANLGNTINYNKNMTVEKLGDGTQLVYNDASSLASFTEANGLAPIRAFIFKITKSSVPSFAIDWIRTFRSVDEMREFAKSESK